MAPLCHCRAMERQPHGINAYRAIGESGRMTLRFLKPR